MYHISKDARAKKSAELICLGLEKCLEEKPFNRISVNDIYKKCFVSRTTFYRLFDSITDVLSYECDNIFFERLKLAETHIASSKKEQALYIIKIWLTHKQLIRALVENNLGWILFETHRKNAELLKKLYPIHFASDLQLDYFISILSSFICSSLFVYFRHNESEILEDVYKIICDCISTINHSFNS